MLKRTKNHGSMIYLSKNSRLYAMILLIMTFLCVATLSAQSRLLYVEAQAVGSYESVSDSLHAYSMNRLEAMQKPSIGFDLIQRFGSESRDWGYLALQGRLAYDASKEWKIEPQLYNAYIDFKARDFDLWIGHNKPATGLSSVLDNHSALLADNTMSGLVLDRDWGLGMRFDRNDPSMSVSLTTGSGMTPYWDKSWLLSTRAGIGDFSRDDLSLGVTLAAGNMFRSMGYTIMHGKVAHEILLTGVDLSRRVTNWELRSEALYGSFHGAMAYTALARLTWYPLPENRMDFSVQGQFQELKAAADQNYSAAIGFRILPDLTLRTSYNYKTSLKSSTVALQLYYYKALRI